MCVRVCVCLDTIFWFLVRGSNVFMFYLHFCVCTIYIQANREQNNIIPLRPTTKYNAVPDKLYTK